MQLVTSAGLVVIGLLLALLMDATDDVRLYGWVVVGVGVLGLASRWWMARLRADESRQRGS
jgi:hypothetical protein